jgi:hypothetical protein
LASPLGPAADYVLGIGYADLVAGRRAFAEDRFKISHCRGFGDGIGPEVKVPASRFSKGQHASAP